MLGQLRFALVKQTTQSDLYCATADARPADLLESTLMRSGPFALFSRFDTDFLVVETCEDEECQIWQQPATERGWYRLEDLWALEGRIPGRDYGQRAYAKKVEEVDWGNYDIVLSVDVSVPARITRLFPEVLWCHYVREPRTSAWSQAQARPLRGQDVFLNQAFDLFRKASAPHVVDFPYYFQYVGCFSDISPMVHEELRGGAFLEHHSVPAFTEAQLARLSTSGALFSTGSEMHPSARLSHCGTLRERIIALSRAKYFVHVPGVRNVWGNAMVEAVACGCLALGAPGSHTNASLFDRDTAIDSTDDALDRIQWFERRPERFSSALARQRRLLDALCFARPAHDLVMAFHRKHGKGQQELRSLQRTNTVLDREGSL